MQHHHPAPPSIWRILVLDLFLLLLLGGHGVLPEQVHGCLGFTKETKRNHPSQKRSLHYRSNKYKRASHVLNVGDVDTYTVVVGVQ